MFANLPAEWHGPITRACSIVLTLGFITYLHVVFGEQMPKIAALQAKLEQQQQQQNTQQDEKQILAALESYRTAYQAKDLNTLSEIWLTVPRADLQRTFKEADRIEVTLTPSAPVINGDSATITSGQRIVIVVHGKAVSQNSATILFSLEKIQGHWLIRTAK